MPTPKKYDADGFSEEEEDAPESFQDYLYKQAVLNIRKNANKYSKENLLYFYARYKFITDGVCNTPRPSGMFNFEAKQKWESWNALKTEFLDLNKDLAKEQYCKKLDSVNDSWREQLDTPDEFGSAQESGTFGIRMSAMASNEESLLDSEKTCFDLCKEGSFDKLKEYFQNIDNSLKINELDEGKMSLLMWACDRGSSDMVDFLITEHNADINLQDMDGQTCLHYAASCDHHDIVKFLLKNKNINIDLLDSDGLKASESTDNKEIIDLFNLK